MRISFTNGSAIEFTPLQEGEEQPKGFSKDNLYWTDD